MMMMMTTTPANLDAPLRTDRHISSLKRSQPLAMLEDVLEVEMRASRHGVQFYSSLDTRADDRVDARQHFC